jgi:CBS domain-containing protein
MADEGWGRTVRAGEMAAPFPTVGLDTPAVEAARLLAGQNLPGLIVVDEAGRPWTVLPGTQVLRMAVPAYCQDDPALARVIDEAGNACRSRRASCRWWIRTPRCWRSPR